MVLGVVEAVGGVDEGGGEGGGEVVEGVFREEDCTGIGIYWVLSCCGCCCCCKVKMSGNFCQLFRWLGKVMALRREGLAWPAVCHECPGYVLRLITSP